MAEKMLMKCPELENIKIGFIGGGRIAKAICKGITNNGAFPFSRIYVAGPTCDSLFWWRAQGATLDEFNGHITSVCDVVFFCVKPHMLKTMVQQIKDTLPEGLESSLQTKIFISVLAGVSLKEIEEALSILPAPKDKPHRIVRLMPNTPMEVMEGCSLYTLHSTVSAEDKELLIKILSVTGMVEEIDEKYMDAGMALTSCGPVFVYHIIEGLIEGAEMCGLDKELAHKLAPQMVLGAAKMMRDTDKDICTLKLQVCTPEGASDRALWTLGNERVKEGIIEALKAATSRARELAENPSLYPF